MNLCRIFPLTLFMLKDVFSGWGGICLTALIGFKNIARTREPLLKGKAQYSWPPCSNPFRWAHSIKKILFTFLTKKLP
jgi:hypothetical protein